MASVRSCLMALCVFCLVRSSLGQRCNETCDCVTDQTDNSVIINCSNRNLTEITSDWWPANTKEINLSFNNVLKVVLPTPSNVTKLTMSHNSLHLLEPGFFQSFPHLEELDLSHNMIGAINERALKEVKMLRRLNLAHNELSLIPNNVFAELTNLEDLSMAHNPEIKELHPNLFKYNEQLRMVDISYLGLTNVPEAIFFHNPDVESLNMAGNSLNSFPLLMLLKLQNLKYLDISETHISNLNSSSMEGLTNIEHFVMNRSPMLSIIGHEAFGQMTHLKELELSDNPKLSLVDGRAFFAFGRPLQNLEKVYLNNNALSTLSSQFGEFCHDSSLREFHLEGNPWMCDCQIDWMLKCRPIYKFRLNITCAEPAQLKDMPLLELKQHALECRHESIAKQARVRFFIVILGTCSISIMILSAILLMKRKDLREWYKSRQRRTGSVYYVKAPQNNTVMNPYSDPVDPLTA